MKLAPWLQADYDALVQAQRDHRLPHALLIHGAGGWGELALANRLALHLIERDVEDAAVVAHPDLRWIAPEGAGEQIKIDSVRAVAEFMVQTPQIAARKAVVLAGAETMNPHAANALLKTLEEPPANSYLILVTDALSEMLPTIRSRCRLIPIRPGNAAVASAWVSQHADGAQAPASAALGFEYGNAPYRLLEAIERGEQPIAPPLADVAARRADPLELAELWSRVGATGMVERWMRYVPAVLSARYGRPTEHVSDVAAALADAPGEAMLQFWKRLVAARALLRGPTNPNGRLLLESLLLDWRDLAHRL